MDFSIGPILFSTWQQVTAVEPQQEEQSSYAQVDST
eukprot:COSAG02_NODE_1279_length_13487_cov_7.611696_9_plen_36_part_00